LLYMLMHIMSHDVYQSGIAEILLHGHGLLCYRFNNWEG
jgi:hypothetical protein